MSDLEKLKSRCDIAWNIRRLHRVASSTWTKDGCDATANYEAMKFAVDEIERLQAIIAQYPETPKSFS